MSLFDLFKKPRDLQQERLDRLEELEEQNRVAKNTRDEHMAEFNKSTINLDNMISELNRKHGHG